MEDKITIQSHVVEFTFLEQTNYKVVFLVPLGTFQEVGTKNIKVCDTELDYLGDISNHQEVSLSSDTFEKIHKSVNVEDADGDPDECDKLYYQAYANRIYKELRDCGEKRGEKMQWNKFPDKVPPNEREVLALIKYTFDDGSGDSLTYMRVVHRDGLDIMTDYIGAAGTAGNLIAEIEDNETVLYWCSIPKPPVS